MIFKAGVASVFVLIATAARVQAGDSGDLGLKDPIPDNLSWHGVTLYGTIDLDYAYQTHGVPLGASFYPGLEYNISGSKNANKPISSLAESGLEQSKIGLKIEEPIGNGWVAIGKLEAGFDPLSGELADACASLVSNNGKPLTAQDANSDGSRCGQAFSGPAFAGVSNSTYGTLTAGRQQSLELDAISGYDPMGLPYAFSLIGYSGGSAAGIGNTETGRWDNSAKYVYQWGPAHAAGMYSSGGPGTAMFGGGYGFDAGAAYRGFSIDAVYTRENSAVSSSSIKPSATCPGTGCEGNVLSGTVTDSEAWSVMAKYVYDLGGFKDEGPGGKLSFYAGYVHIDMGNPQSPVAAGSETIGGYELLTVNNQPYAPGSNKVLQTFWAGAKYELASGLSFTAAYYRLGQDAYRTSAAAGTNTCAFITSGNRATAGFVGNPVAGNCAGDLNQVSFLIDYPLNKHFDVYSGISYSEVSGGLACGFLSGNTAAFVSGLRLKF
ncbi:MAG: porin [Rhodomicrobium sp.]